MTITIRAYLRVSTSSQDLAMQTLALQKTVEARGTCWDSVVKYEDAGLSGKNADRPQYQALLVALQPGDTLLAYSLSRLTRSMRDLASLIELCLARNVTLITIKDSIDLSSASGRMIVGLLGVLAQFEREQIQERTRDGLAAAKAKGMVPGRGSFCSLEDRDVALLHRQRPELSGRAIAKLLNRPPASVARVLTKLNPSWTTTTTAS